MGKVTLWLQFLLRVRGANVEAHVSVDAASESSNKCRASTLIMLVRMRAHGGKKSASALWSGSSQGGRRESRLRQSPSSSARVTWQSIALHTPLRISLNCRQSATFPAKSGTRPGVRKSEFRKSAGYRHSTGSVTDARRRVRKCNRHAKNK